MKTKIQIIAVCLLSVMSITSCDKYRDDVLVDETMSQKLAQENSEYQMMSTSSYNPTYTEYDVSPSKFGKPNSTNFTFKVKDVSGSQPLSVKFFERATGTVNIIPMTRIGTDWVLTKQMINNWWFDYRYVYSSTGNPISSTLAKELCATYNTFSSTGYSSIKWLFGADGSSFTNRLGWYGAKESEGCGSGWNINGHKYQSCLADDSYAEDWNKYCKTNGLADDDAEIKSPLDGKVIKVTVNGVPDSHGGYGNSIDIEQVTANATYVFRVAHLKYAPPSSVAVGTWVKAGYTKIGNVGMTGGTSSGPHAHIVLYKKNSCYAPMKFYLNAN